ncbi:hypothetical protein ACFL2C_00620 [Patescibacteria group bacterium]
MANYLKLPQLEGGIQPINKVGRFWFFFIGVGLLFFSFNNFYNFYKSHSSDLPFETNLIHKRETSNFITGSYESITEFETISIDNSFELVSGTVFLSAGLLLLMFAVFPKRNEHKKLKLFLIGLFIFMLPLIWIFLIVNAVVFSWWLCVLCGFMLFLGGIVIFRSFRMK